MSEDDSTGSARNDDSNDQKTILYCLTREALTEDDLIDLKDDLSERFSIEPAGDDKIAIKKDVNSSGSTLDVGSVLSED